MSPVQLSPESAAALQSLTKKIKDAQYELNRAKSAKLDVAAHQKLLDDAIELRNNLLRTYGPGVPFEL